MEILVMILIAALSFQFGAAYGARRINEYYRRMFDEEAAAIQEALKSLAQSAPTQTKQQNFLTVTNKCGNS